MDLYLFMLVVIPSYNIHEPTFIHVGSYSFLYIGSYISCGKNEITVMIENWTNHNNVNNTTGWPLTLNTEQTVLTGIYAYNT